MDDNLARQRLVMNVAAIITLNGRRLKVTAHAVDRYWERAVPACPDWTTARRHLLHVLQTAGDVHARPPRWAAAHDHLDTLADRATGWVVIGDDIALPLVGNLVVTCVCRGGISDLTRRRRNETRKQLRHRRRKHRTGNHTEDRRAAARRRDGRSPDVDDQAA